MEDIREEGRRWPRVKFNLNKSSRESPWGTWMPAPRPPMSAEEFLTGSVRQEHRQRSAAGLSYRSGRCGCPEALFILMTNSLKKELIWGSFWFLGVQSGISLVPDIKNKSLPRNQNTTRRSSLVPGDPGSGSEAWRSQGFRTGPGGPSKRPLWRTSWKEEAWQ